MNNTALKAGTLSANNTHIVFANEEHEKFYYEKLQQVGYLRPIPFQNHTSATINQRQSAQSA